MTVSLTPGGAIQGISFAASTEGTAYNQLNLSSLHLPLTDTVVPARGSSTPTFTRATAAWSFDNEGKLNLNVPSGCARFKGGRLVRNRVPKSSDFSSAEWSVANLTKVSTAIADPLGGTAGCELSSAGALLDHYITGGSVTSVSYTSGTDNCFSCYAKAGSITKVQLTHATTAFGSSQYANFDLVSGTVVKSTGCTPYVVDIGGGWFRLMIVATATTTANGGSGAVSALVTGNEGRLPTTTASGNFYIALPQDENVSGQADQTASEYVSVGVLSSPYHGAGVDGCKWFPTNKNGSAISASTLEGYLSEPVRTNNCLWGRLLNTFGTEATKVWTSSTTTSLLTNGDFSTNDLTAWTNVSSGTGTASAATGAAVLVGSDSSNRGAIEQGIATVIGQQYLIKIDVTITSGTCGIGISTSPGSPTGTSLASTAGTNKLILFTATATTTYIKMWSGPSGGNITVDNVSASLAGIQVTTTTGLDNVANSASRLTAAANDATIMQLLTAATGTRTASAFIKRISGTGTISLTRDGGTNWTDITSSLVTGSWVLVQMTSDVGANPTVGIKMGTSGDVIDVDCVQDENGAWATSPILTTTAAVTRNADVLSYASAFDVTQGSALCTLQSDVPAGNGMYALGSETGGRLLYWSTAARNRGSSYDAVTVATSNIADDVNMGLVKRGNRWGSDQRCYALGGAGTSVAFDGSMGTSGTLFVGSDQSGSAQISGPIREVHIWPTPLTDTQMKQVTS